MKLTHILKATNIVVKHISATTETHSPVDVMCDPGTVSQQFAEASRPPTGLSLGHERRGLQMLEWTIHTNIKLK